MEWAYASASRVEHVARNVRRQDELEVYLSHGVSGYEAVMESFMDSTICRVILADDYDPVGVTGVCQDRIWLLGTPELVNTKSHRWQLAVHGREWVKYCADVVGKRIGNYAYSENNAALRWLKHLGFTVEDPRPFGLHKEMFCEFWMEP